MNTKLPLIEKYIIRHFPTVREVYFTKHKTYLGSSPELPEDQRTIDVTRINVVIDNSKKVLGKEEVRELVKTIIRDIDSHFNLKMMEYGSSYDTEFFVITTKTFIEYLREN